MSGTKVGLCTAHESEFADMAQKQEGKDETKDDDASGTTVTTGS